VEGWQEKKLFRNEYFREFHPLEIEGKSWRAISWTTAASVVSVIEMVASGKLPQKGFIKQEEIAFNDFLSTDCGSFFK